MRAVHLRMDMQTVETTWLEDPKGTAALINRLQEIEKELDAVGVPTLDVMLSYSIPGQLTDFRTASRLLTGKEVIAMPLSETAPVAIRHKRYSHRESERKKFSAYESEIVQSYVGAIDPDLILFSGYWEVKPADIAEIKRKTAGFVWKDQPADYVEAEAIKDTCVSVSARDFGQKCKTVILAEGTCRFGVIPIEERRALHAIYGIEIEYLDPVLQQIRRANMAAGVGLGTTA